MTFTNDSIEQEEYLIASGYVSSPRQDYVAQRHLALQNVPKRAPVRDPPVRLDGHIERHVLVHLPPTRNDRTPTRNCRVCMRSKKRSETRYLCILCGVPMHKDNCFIRYHTLVEYEM
jgi:hypothetical protein